MYSLDTNFFMDWQARYYPSDVFYSLEQRIEALIQSGTCEAVQIVREEIDAVGTSGLKTWAKNHAALFVPLSAEIQIKAANIEAAYPDLMDPKSLYLSADAYVIPLATVKDGVVVWQELRRWKNAAPNGATLSQTSAVTWVSHVSIYSA